MCVVLIFWLFCLLFWMCLWSCWWSWNLWDSRRALWRVVVVFCFCFCVLFVLCILCSLCLWWCWCCDWLLCCVFIFCWVKIVLCWWFRFGWCWCFCVFCFWIVLMCGVFCCCDVFLCVCEMCVLIDVCVGLWCVCLWCLCVLLFVVCGCFGGIWKWFFVYDDVCDDVCLWVCDDVCVRCDLMLCGIVCDRWGNGVIVCEGLNGDVWWVMMWWWRVLDWRLVMCGCCGILCWVWDGWRMRCMCCDSVWRSLGLGSGCRLLIAVCCRGSRFNSWTDRRNGCSGYSCWWCIWGWNWMLIGLEWIMMCWWMWCGRMGWLWIKGGFERRRRLRSCERKIWKNTGCRRKRWRWLNFLCCCVWLCLGCRDIWGRMILCWLRWRWLWRWMWWCCCWKGWISRRRLLCLRRFVVALRICVCNWMK